MTRFIGYGRREVTLPDELTRVEDHRAAILELLPEPEPILLRLVDALGLVLADDVASDAEVPAFPNAAMDGYAVVSDDLREAAEGAPVSLTVVGEVVAGVAPLDEVVAGTAVRIMTGAPMPAGADAVVPVELTRGSDDEVTFRAPAPPGAHVRLPGEDLTVGQPLVAAGHRLTPADVGLLASAGVALVRCVPAPRVVIVSSGDELVPSDTTPGPGQIRDANGPMLAAMVRAADAVPFSVGIVPDDHRALRNALDTNLGHADLIVCSGGASAGTRDLLPEVIGELGEVASVKVAMRPGMPQIRGRIRGVPVVGLPGNPVSAFVSFEVFVRPAIRRLLRRRTIERPTVWARITEPLTSPPNKRGYIRVQLSRDAGGWVAAPTGPQGSHLVTSIARARGLAIVPEEVVEVPADAEVSVQLLVDG